MVAAGAAAFIKRTSAGLIVSALLLLLAVALLAHAWRTLPQRQYFPYFRLTDAGIHYVWGDSPAGRTSLIPWAAVQSVVPVFASVFTFEEEEALGLRVGIGERGTEFLPIE